MQAALCAVDRGRTTHDHRTQRLAALARPSPREAGETKPTTKALEAEAVSKRANRPMRSADLVGRGPLGFSGRCRRGENRCTSFGLVWISTRPSRLELDLGSTDLVGLGPHRRHNQFL